MKQLSIWKTGLLASSAAIGLALTTSANAQGIGPWGDWRFDDGERGRYSEPNHGNDNDPWGNPAAQSKPQQQPKERVASGGAKPHITGIAPPLVKFTADYKPGTIIIDTKARKLYHVEPGQKAYAIDIGVGREGFSWTGTEKVSRIASWPDWHPPKEMRQRQPELPTKMTGGLRNPLGARAIYLGNTLYRIHGTNDPGSIGRAQSSGCFRMMNEHVVFLAEHVKVGSEVHVVPSLAASAVASLEKQNEPERRASPPARNRPAHAERDRYLDDEPGYRRSQRYPDERYYDDNFDDPYEYFELGPSDMSSYSDPGRSYRR